jgi:hypothetical protein
MVAFMSPIVDGAYSPDKCVNNDAAAVALRVESVKSPELAMTPFILDCIKEFIGFLVPPGEHQKHFPVDLDEVYERQKRPTQRRILESVENLVGDASGAPSKTFQKQETYQKVSAPRIITTIEAVNKLHYSSFVYSLTQCLRATRWYAFGKTPVELSQRVAEICTGAKVNAGMADADKMDGRVSNLLRTAEQMFATAWFHPTVHSRLLEQMQKQQQGKAVTGFGLTYATEYIRLSGSPETADLNSFDTGLIAYTNYRRTVNPNTGVFHTPEEAYASVGIVGGDDSALADVDPAILTETAAMYGQKYEVEIIARGKPGVNFLARIYGPDVWVGDMNSMCDLRRQLSKFHTAVALPGDIPAMKKLAIKAFSYWLTDQHTPVLGELAECVVKNFPHLLKDVTQDAYVRSELATYFAFFPKDVQFPNSFADWMEDIVDRDLHGFDRRRFTRWLKDAAEENASLLTPPLCLAHEPPALPKVAAVVDGDVLPAADGKWDEEMPSSKPAAKPMEPTAPPKVCFDFRKSGKCKWGAKCKFVHEPART